MPVLLGAMLLIAAAVPGPVLAGSWKSQSVWRPDVDFRGVWVFAFNDIYAIGDSGSVVELTSPPCWLHATIKPVIKIKKNNLIFISITS